MNQYEVYVIGAFMCVVLIILGVMFRETMQIQRRNGKKVKGEKLL
jgi:hypothetical protein